MRKAERLNDMLIYLNNKSFFNLKDLMERYRISKSTALRDIEALEQIGMPIFSEAGRNGRYGILKNRLLSPIVFRMDEVYALYFSMLTLRGYQTTPFQPDLDLLKKKFESCLADEHIEKLNKMGQIFSLEKVNHPNASPLLKDILEYALNGQVCTVRYRKKEGCRFYPVQFFDISSSFGQWYATGYNHKTGRTQVFRCDKILAVKDNAEYAPAAPDEIASGRSNIFKHKNAIEFEVHLTGAGADRFYKEHYPSMQLEYEDGIPIIKGFYHEGEEPFITDYLIGYGTDVLSVRPDTLKDLLQQRCQAISRYYEQL